MPDMNIVDFSNLQPLPYQRSCVTVGNFDGVHKGHHAILKQMVQQASSQELPVVVVTFFPNPAVFFNPIDRGFYLSSPDEKETLLRAMGVDKVLTLKFDQDFADLSPQAFLSALKNNLGLHVLVVGRDFTLGKSQQGTIPVIESIGKALSFAVKAYPPIKLDGDEVSSTAIRQTLDVGCVERAAALLGRLYAVHGKVIHGSDRGSSIGLPTANLSHWPFKKLPAVGVYATYVSLDGETYPGITNIGYRPTFEKQTAPNIETHILSFDGNIYGKELTVAFYRKIREEQKFPGVDAFLAQIEKDKATAQRFFSYDQR